MNINIGSLIVGLVLLLSLGGWWWVEQGGDFAAQQDPVLVTRTNRVATVFKKHVAEQLKDLVGDADYLRQVARDINEYQRVHPANLFTVEGSPLWVKLQHEGRESQVVIKLVNDDYNDPVKLHLSAYGANSDKPSVFIEVDLFTEDE